MLHIQKIKQFTREISWILRLMPGLHAILEAPMSLRHLNDFGLDVKDPDKTFFTFDCNPTGSDQKYASKSAYMQAFCPGE